MLGFIFGKDVVSGKFDVRAIIPQSKTLETKHTLWNKTSSTVVKCEVS